MHTESTFILADNQAVTRAGMQQFISVLFGEGRTLQACGKRELSQVLAQCGQSVVVLDYTLFDLNGVEDFFILMRRFPQVHWILFSEELSETFLRQAGGERNISILLKDASEKEILTTLQRSAQGERYLCHQVENLLCSVPAKPEMRSVLTTTEREVLKLIVHGKSAKEVAQERHSSIHTVITHKKNIFRKLGVNNVYEATKYALRAGLVEMVEYYI